MASCARAPYPAVVIPVQTGHDTMLQRNLFHTGAGRGRTLVFLVAQKEAVVIAVGNISGCRRWSKLRQWLAGNGGPGLPPAGP